jgi:hypothetical protein
MTKFGALNKQGAIIMALVLSCQLLTGTGFFCAGKIPNLSRSVVSDRTASAGATVSREDDSAGPGIHADDHGGTLPCTCKKQKKCPTIPRSTLTSNPTYRFNEVQRQFWSASADALTPDLTDYRVASGGSPPFLRSAWDKPFSPYTPLGISCVLLI